MKAIILGAGEGYISCSKSNSYPTALHSIQNKHSLKYLLEGISRAGIQDIIFVGGSGIEHVIKEYPGLKFYYNDLWSKTGPLYSLSRCLIELSDSCVIFYSDILHSPKTIYEIVQLSDDFVIAEDENWISRFNGRGHALYADSEKISSNDTVIHFIGRDIPPHLPITGQFAGILKISSSGADILRELLMSLVKKNRVSLNGTTTLYSGGIPDLIQELLLKGQQIRSFRIDERWAELDSPQDIAQFLFGTKAETLERLQTKIKKSHILNQYRFTRSEWNESKQEILESCKIIFGGKPVIVRSSAIGEDSFMNSQAGKYKSFLDISVNDTLKLFQGIDAVFKSYEDDQNQHQCLIQPFLDDTILSGVIFTRDSDTFAPYYIVNYEKSGKTDGVTSGISQNQNTIIVYRRAVHKCWNPIKKVLEAIHEIESIVGYDSLDIEFGVTADGVIYIFQVRPLISNNKHHIAFDEDLNNEISGLCRVVTTHITKSERLLGDLSILGVMPDWNPAEMIGRNPRPLAMSLYKYLITDQIWGIQRAEYGYRNTFPSPLMITLAGQGYIDTRASFNSFIPAELDDILAEKLVNYYLYSLKQNPHLHDKIEFEIAYTCYTFDFAEQSKRLLEYGFSHNEIQNIKVSLLKLTNNILKRSESQMDRLDQDIAMLEQFNSKKKRYSNVSSLINNISSNLEMCKKYGTLPFAHYARSAFLSTALLKSMVSTGVFTNQDYIGIFGGIQTIAGRIIKDISRMQIGELPLSVFLKKYGHLRPGTYDILSPRYDEEPDSFFSYKGNEGLSYLDKSEDINKIWLNKKDLIEKIITEHGIDSSSDHLLSFIIRSIQGREYAKFIFTKTISDTLQLIKKIGLELNLTKEQMSFIPITELISILNSSPLCSCSEELRDLVKRREKQFSLTRAIKLPMLITGENDLIVFELFQNVPNYITSQTIIGQVLRISSVQDSKYLTGKIIHIVNADPGYDWLFSHPIGGLITTYGGANSHMAIRANEFNIPAAIGCGEIIDKKLINGITIELNCESKQINFVS